MNMENKTKRIQFRNSNIIQSRKGKVNSIKKQQEIGREGFIFITGDTGGVLNPQKYYIYSLLSKDWKEERINVQQESLLYSSSGYATFTHH